MVWGMNVYKRIVKPRQLQDDLDRTFNNKGQTTPAFLARFGPLRIRRRNPAKRIAKRNTRASFTRLRRPSSKHV